MNNAIHTADRPLESITWPAVGTVHTSIGKRYTAGRLLTLTITLTLTLTLTLILRDTAGRVYRHYVPQFINASESGG